MAYLVEKWSHKRCCVPVVTYQVRIPKISQRANSLVGSRSAHCEIQLRVENIVPRLKSTTNIIYLQKINNILYVKQIITKNK